MSDPPPDSAPGQGDGTPADAAGAPAEAEGDELARADAVERSATSGRPRWQDGRVALVLLALLHLGLLLYFAPPSVMLSPLPVSTVDYSLHVYQVSRAMQGWADAGQLWCWDPLQLAGQPAGIAEDLTSKGTELFVIALSSFGLPPGLAFNLLILIVHWGLLPAGWFSARLFGLSRGAAAVTVLLWQLMWFYDSLLHWSWWIGMITWGFACYATVLLTAILFRLLEDRRTWLFVPMTLVAAAIALLHPFGVITVLVPCGWLYLREAKRMPRHYHALLWLSAAAAGSTALVWAPASLRLIHYVGDADTFFNATPKFLFFDLFDLVKDGRQTGAPVRTMFRTLTFAAGFTCLWRWHKGADRRLVPVAAFVLTALIIGYGAGLFAAGRQTQPYRQLGPAMLMAAIPAAVLLREYLAPSALRALSGPAKVLLGICCLLIAPRAVRTVLQYTPHLIPERVNRAMIDYLTSPLVGLGEPVPNAMRHEGPEPEWIELRQWLLDNHGGRGRILVKDWVVAEFLTASTPLPYLGGITERNVPHVDANVFRKREDGNLPGPELSRYFERYAVGFVVMSNEKLHDPLDYRRDVLEPVAAPGGFRVYRTKIEPSWFMRGQGTIAEQRINRVRVTNARGSELVLRFHWLETLRCRPGCSVERHELDWNRPGFIRVKNPPPAFEIYNSYELP